MPLPMALLIRLIGGLDPSAHLDGLRVGTVQPGRTERLLLRSAALGAGGSVTIIARVSMLNRAPSTGAVTLLPGDRVDVTLTSQANMLSIVPSP